MVQNRQDMYKKVEFRLIYDPAHEIYLYGQTARDYSSKVKVKKHGWASF